MSEPFISFIIIASFCCMVGMSGFGFFYATMRLYKSFVVATPTVRSQARDNFLAYLLITALLFSLGWIVTFEATAGFRGNASAQTINTIVMLVFWGVTAHVSFNKKLAPAFGYPKD